jgi:hypothetical protein
MNDVSKTLEERGTRYGAFRDHATIAQGLQEVLWESPGWYRLQPDVRQMCVVITDKIARILNGDPDYTDNYHDIQGYAKLVEDRLLKEQKAQKGELFEPPSEEEELERETVQEHPFNKNIDFNNPPPLKATIPENSKSFKEWEERNGKNLGKGYNPGTGYDG